MITRIDAINIGAAIIKGRNLEASRYKGEGTIAEFRSAIRGTAIRALDNLWYDVLPIKVRESFGRSKDSFYTAVGWDNETITE